MSSIDQSIENSTQIPEVSSWTHFKLDHRSPAGRGSDGFGYRFVLAHRLEAAWAEALIPGHRFRSNEVRLWLSVIAYDLVNLWRRLALPRRIGNWSLTSLQQRLVKTGGRLVAEAAGQRAA